MNLFKRKNTHPSVRSSLEAFFKEYNVTVTKQFVDESDDSHNYYFDFQDGHFIADVVSDDNFATVWFPSFYDVEDAQIDAVRIACNKFNYYMRIFKASYSYDEEKNVYNLHMSFGVEYIDTREFARRLEACFNYQRRFIEMYEALAEDSEEDSEHASNLHHHSRFLISQQEMSHSGDDMSEHRFDPNECYTFGRIVERLTAIPGITYKELTISSVADGVKVLTDHSQIAGTDVLHALVNEDATGYRTSVVTMAARYATPANLVEARYLTLTLTPAGTDEYSCYIRATITDIPGDMSDTDPFDGRQPQVGSESVLLALDRESTKKKQEEFKYMWEDAKLKLKSGEKLSAEQKFLASILAPTEGYSFYWGMRLFHQGRYHAALAHLEQAYEQIRLDIVDRETYERFLQYCFYIGFCYNELGNERLAFFYLNHVSGSANIQYVEEYVNALANYGDLRTLKVIEHYYEEITQVIKESDDEEVSSRMEEFREFLLRRRGYVLIEFNRLDEAEELFKELLDSPNSHDYAVNELATIQRLRRVASSDDDAQE